MKYSHIDLHCFNKSKSKLERYDLSGFPQKTDKKYPSYKEDALAKEAKEAENAGFAKELSPKDRSPRKTTIG